MDFVSDALANGRRLKCLTVADDFTHESIDITVDHGISGAYAVRVLDRAARFRGYPRAVRTDNGPGFTSRDECLNEHWFTSLVQASEIIGEWRRDHNEARPHSSRSEEHTSELQSLMRNSYAVFCLKKKKTKLTSKK